MDDRKIVLRGHQPQGAAEYEVRHAPWRPKGWVYPSETFSVGIGEAGTRRAAIYRVGGSSQDEAQIDALADRLVCWLNDPERDGACPFEVPWSNDRSARIRLTAAGRKAGWLK